MGPVTGKEKENTDVDGSEETSLELQDDDGDSEEFSAEEIEDFKTADEATAEKKGDSKKTGSDGDAAASTSDDSAEPSEKQEKPTSPEGKAEETEVDKAEEKPKAEGAPDPAAQKGTPGTELTTPEAMAAQWSELRKNAEVELSKHYALSADEVEELGRNAEVTIPKLMAKVYMDVYQTLFSNVISVLPKLVGDVSTAHRQAEENEAKFFGTWKDLAAHPQGKETAHRLAVAYRQVYPNASLDDIIRDVGAQAMIALKIPFNGLSTTVESEELAEYSGSLPGGGSPPAKPPAKKPSNYFAALAEAEEAEILE